MEASQSLLLLYIAQISRLKYLAIYQDITNKIIVKIKRYLWLAFTGSAGDSDADDTVVEQQQSSALCPRHLHHNTQHFSESVKNLAGKLGAAHLAGIVELQPLNIVLSEQHPRSLALPDLPSDRAQLLVERRRLLALALPLVEHLREGLEGGEGQLEGHPVPVAGRRLLQQVLEEEDELGEALDRLHHQPKEVEPVVGRDLLHLGRKAL